MRSFKYYFLCVALSLSSIFNVTKAADWFVFDTISYWSNIQCLSDSSVWLDDDSRGISVYKDGNVRYLEEFWHQVNQHFFINSFCRIVDNYQNSKWVFNHAVYKMTKDGDTIQIYNPNFESILDAVLYQNYIWMVSGDTSGITRFDGTQFINFHKQDTEVSSTDIGFRQIVVDNSGIFWLVNNDGLYKYNLNTDSLIRFDSTNSNLPGKGIVDLKIDKTGLIWLALIDIDDWQAKVCSFDGNSFTLYNGNNSMLPKDTLIPFAQCIAIDSNNNKWIGTGWGLYKYDGANWTRFIKEDSGLPDNNINNLCFDKYGNLWVGTSKGLAIYKEGGVNLPTSVNDEKKDIPSFSVFPNPSENTIKIKYSNDTSGQVKITLTDMNGNIKMERVRNSEGSDEQTDIIDTSALEAGTYFVKVQAGKVSAVNKVVIVK